jgi:hypothetical protein
MSKIHTKSGSMCSICDQAVGEDGVTLHRTRRQTHKLCEVCVDGYLAPQISQVAQNLRKNIKVNTIDCCGTYHSNSRNHCTEKIQISGITCSESSSIYTDLFRVQHVLSNPNVYICPVDTCGEIVEVMEDDPIPRTVCPSCKIIWCRTCLLFPYHENVSCMEYEVSQNKTENGKLIYKLKADKKLHFCPRCKIPTLKNSGCNKMWCVTCKVKWCWLCQKSDIDYDHFNSEGSNPCANKLYE